MDVLPPDRWVQVDQVFTEALDHPADERVAFVRQVCGDDEDLFNEVMTLFECRIDAQNALGESATGFAAPLLPDLHDHLARAASMITGTRVGPYRIIDEIGRGGMGAVYLAERDDGQFTKEVALKLVKRGMDTDEILLRFRYERQILAALEHAHIARLHDGGVSDDGRPYLAMEYVNGVAIDRYCDERCLSVDARLGLFATVCEAVQYAHQNLVVHRDLKPSNILVTEDGQVKLLDFGIAKLLDEEAGVSAPVTRTGVRVMTPEYASPEQIRGETITTATDVYALGVILYELLTGHRPYEALDGNALDAQRSILEREPERPSTAVTKGSERRQHGGTTGTMTPEAVGAARATNVERLQRRLRGDLDVIVLKALRKEPARRYASAEAFVEDIKRHLAGLPVTARPATPGYRLFKFVQRHRVGVGLGGLVALLVMGFAIAMIVQKAETARARDEAEAIAVSLEDLFATLDPFSPNAERADTLRVRDMLDRGTEKVRQELQDQPAVQARMLHVLGQVYYKSGLYEQARLQLEASLALHRSIYGAKHIKVGETLQSLAGVFEETGDYAAAEPLYREALALYQAGHGDHHAKVAQAMSQLGYIYRLTGEFDRAEPLIRRALEINRALVQEPDVAFANSLTRFGIMLQEKGDYAAAIAVHQEALEIRQHLFEPGHPRLATSTMNLAVVITQNGDYQAAEPLAQEALAISRAAAQDEPHFKTATALHALAVILDKTGRDEQAKDLFREALAMFIQLFGENHRRVATTLVGLGAVSLEQKNLEAAETYYQQALAITGRVLGDSHPQMVSGLNGLADLYRQQGNYEAATSKARQALTLAENLDPDHPRTASVKHTLARIAYDRGDLEQAEALFRETLVVQQRLLLDDHPDVLETQRWLGACLTARGHYQKAEQWLLRSYEPLAATYGKTHPQTQRVLAHLVALYEAWGKADKATEYQAQRIDASL